MKIAYENDILQSPEIVFSWIAEPEKAMQWQKNVKGGKVIKKSPEIVGTTFTEVIEEDGRTLEMKGIITDYKKNSLIGFHIESRIHVFDVSYQVEAISGGSRLAIEATIKWKFPMNIISLFIGKIMEKNITKQLESEVSELKKLCED